MSYKSINMALAVSLMCVTAGAPAEDIDLFSAPIPETQKPNVLIILDNTANWNQAFSNELSALVSALDNLPTAEGGLHKFNVGLMLFTESGGDNGAPGGAYVRAAVRNMNADNKVTYQELFKSLDKLKDKGDSAAFGLAMAEAYRYFAGADAYAGHNKVKRDYSFNSVASYPESNAIYALPGNALASQTSTTYVSPISGKCQQNIIIFVSNGPSDLGENSGNTPASLLAAAGGKTTKIPLTPNGREDVTSDEWARFLANNDIHSLSGEQTVKTYTVDVDPKATGQGPDNTALLRSMARQGRGSYFSVSSANGGQQIADALKRIFSEIQSVDSAFASASLPVSVNTQGTYLNQVFIGMFRPEAAPRWFGNLKQYQFRADVNANGDVVELTLADKTNAPAINPQNGFISPCAQSYWSTADTYWPSDYLGSCIAADVRSNSPDGEIIEKGAVAQRLRTLSGGSAVAARNFKTCVACSDNSVPVSFDTSAASITALGVSSAEHSELVAWVRGQNVESELSKSDTAIRPSVHGDVVHSRPLAIDYGGDTGVVVFYGSNDGTLRAVNGNKPDTAGNELWAFVAPEHYAKFKRLKTNSPVISFPGVSTTDPDPEPTPKDYFFDGSIGVYRESGTVWVYPTMRRGGSYVYAFDVSTPTNPILKWKRGPGPGELANLGQTWSEPKVVKVAGYPSNSTTKSPVLIMGGGYDPCEDQDTVLNTECAAPKGNRVFVLDADTGQVLKALPTDRSVAADVTVVDSDNDGYTDIAYAVDTGANIYRVNIGTNDPAAWTITKIASLGCDSGHCGRKFLHAPEVVVGIDFNAVLVGSGNRERPLLSNQATIVDNAFFMIKDDRSAAPALVKASALLRIDQEQESQIADDMDLIAGDTGLTEEERTAKLAELAVKLAELTAERAAALASATNKGWYLAFGSGIHDKEQVVTSAVVVAGVVYFSTHTPTPLEENECSNLGLARGYAVNFLDASAENGSSRFTVFSGGGLPPSPVTGVVSVALTGSDGSPLKGSDGSPLTANVPFIIGGGGISGIDPTKVVVNPSGVRGRVYWYIDNE